MTGDTLAYVLAIAAIIANIILAVATYKGARINGHSLIESVREQHKLDSEAKREQWKRDEEARRQTQEREDRIRYHYQRAQAYANFMTTANAITPGRKEKGWLLFAQRLGEAFRAREWRRARDEYEPAYFQIHIFGRPYHFGKNSR